jgi:putative transposase
MQHVDSIFTHLLKVIDRRAFKAIVARHNGDAYDKHFDSWSHLVALVFAQFSSASSLRALVSEWNAHAHCHYHLGAGAMARSTLADANARRPVGVLADCFAMLSATLDRRTRHDSDQLLRLIDSTPVPLRLLHEFATWNGRIRGLKMHVVYDPAADRPMHVEISAATVNDIEVGRQTPLEAGATYAFDKAYCHYGWWTKIDAAKAFFVTRPKTNARFTRSAQRLLDQAQGDGFCILSDEEVALTSKGDSKLSIKLRRILVKRQGAKSITLITNDMTRTAVEIGAIYKARWQIELLFRWIKQNLDIKKFIGRSENAVRLQIIAAMIAFVLLRLAAKLYRITLPSIRFAQLVCACLFSRRPIAKIDKPPPSKPSKRYACVSINQYEFKYA